MNPSGPMLPVFADGTLYALRGTTLNALMASILARTPLAGVGLLAGTERRGVRLSVAGFVPPVIEAEAPLPSPPPSYPTPWDPGPKPGWVPAYVDWPGPLNPDDAYYNYNAANIRDMPPWWPDFEAEGCRLILNHVIAPSEAIPLIEHTLTWEADCDYVWGSDSDSDSSASSRGSASKAIHFSAGRWLGWEVVEDPIAPFEDIVPVRVWCGRGEAVVDPRLLGSCEPGSIRVIEVCLAKRDSAHCAHLAENRILVHAPGRSCEALVRVRGARRLHGARWPVSTREAAAANEHFYRSALNA